jgi:glycine/D-amino acid oxidase-like deaminating enzyme
MDMSMDGSPIIDRTPVGGLYLNAGWCYGGFKATPASGWCFAHTIARDEQQADWLVKTIGRDLHSGGWTYVAQVAGPASMESGFSRIG